MFWFISGLLLPLLVFANLWIACSVTHEWEYNDDEIFVSQCDIKIQNGYFECKHCGETVECWYKTKRKKESPDTFLCRGRS